MARKRAARKGNDNGNARDKSITSGKLEELPNHPDYTEEAPPAGHIFEGDGTEGNPNRVVRDPRWTHTV